MKLIIDIDNNEYELINKTCVTYDWHTVFHGKEKDKEMTLAIFDLVKALKNGTPYEERPQGNLISRDALKKDIDFQFICECCHNNGNTCDICPVAEIEKKIDEASTVETSKIEHKAYNEGFKDGVDQGIRLSQTPGEWEEDSGNIACSHCHTIWLYRRTEFCPNCGAKMQKEGKEE